MRLYCLLISLFSIYITSLVLALPTSQSSVQSLTPPYSLPLSVHLIHEFLPKTWVENIAVRQNGRLLVTILSTPDLYQVDPVNHSAPILIHTFPPALGLLGITEGALDHFYVVVGNFSVFTDVTTQGSFSLWEVDMTTFFPRLNTSATVTKVTDLPSALQLNGATTLPQHRSLILIADPIAGAVWRVNLTDSQVLKVIDNPLMKPSGTLPLGINGLKVWGQSLYFTNSNTGNFVRIPIDPSKGTATGEASIIATNGTGDDFQLDARGNAYIASDFVNELTFVDVKEKTETVLTGGANSTILPGPTACAFGRTRKDREKGGLYITTSGGFMEYQSGVFPRGGSVVRVDVGKGVY